MKKMYISFNFSVTNGEWDQKTKIERSHAQEHEIDLALINDENTFPHIMATIKREFEDRIEKAINTVMQRMIDDKPDSADTENSDANRNT